MRVIIRSASENGAQTTVVGDVRLPVSYKERAHSSSVADHWGWERERSNETPETPTVEPPVMPTAEVPPEPPASATPT